MESLNTVLSAKRATISISSTPSSVLTYGWFEVNLRINLITLRIYSLSEEGWIKSLHMKCSSPSTVIVSRSMVYLDASVASFSKHEYGTWLSCRLCIISTGRLLIPRRAYNGLLTDESTPYFSFTTWRVMPASCSAGIIGRNASRLACRKSSRLEKAERAIRPSISLFSPMERMATAPPIDTPSTITGTSLYLALLFI